MRLYLFLFIGFLSSCSILNPTRNNFKYSEEEIFEIGKSKLRINQNNNFFYSPKKINQLPVEYRITQKHVEIFLMKKDSLLMPLGNRDCTVGNVKNVLSMDPIGSIKEKLELYNVPPEKLEKKKYTFFIHWSISYLKQAENSESFVLDFISNSTHPEEFQVIYLNSDFSNKYKQNT